MMTKLSRDELGAYFALVSAGDLVQRAVSSQLAEHGLTPLQFSILATLLEADQGLRMSDLAEALVVSRSGLTYQIAQLEKSELVTRVSSSDDSRGIVAQLTPTGRDRVLEAFPGHVSLVRENFLDLLTPTEIETLRSELEKVVAHLRDA
jgi:DNA-binding MarR family transcriptional regulator